MNPRITFYILLIILLYSLYYTYNNDFGMFLYLVLLIVAGLFIYEYIEYRINYYSEKIDITLSDMKSQINNNLSDVKTKIDNSLVNIDFIKNIITSLFNQNK